MSASTNGQLESRYDHYNYNAPIPSIPADLAAPLPHIQTRGPGGRVDIAEVDRSYSPSPVQNQARSVSSPVTSSTNALGTARSTPVLVPSRQLGSVKDIAHRFDQGAAAAGSRPPQLTVRTSQERYRRSPAGKSAVSRSPVGASGSRGESGMAKLQKRRPGQSKSPQKSSPATSFETSSSISSNVTITSTRSQPQPAFTSQKPKSPAKPASFVHAKPLFGELTADGWHGNFDLSSYGPLPTFERTPRRQSDGSIALGHGRSQSHQDIARPGLSPPAKPPLHHKRSRSEMDAPRPQAAPSMSALNSRNIPALYPTPPDSATRSVSRLDSPTSRIPVSSRRQSQDSASTSDPYSRSVSAMSNPTGRRKLSKSPTRMKYSAGKENATPTSLPRSRYQPPPISTSLSNQMLSAKIVAPPPKTSPPLRSSRPRQPVSSATTSASRARAAERFQGPIARDGRRPSEQWLGKPYDAYIERTRRKIPELQKVDFAERRARIQKAISQNLEETESREVQMSQSRKASLEADAQAAAGADGRQCNSVDRNQAAEMDEETDRLEATQFGAQTARTRGLSLDTTHIPELQEPEPTTAATEFEVDESPVLGRPTPQAPRELHQEPQEAGEEQPVLLSSATYQPRAARARTPPPVEPVQEAPEEEVESPSVLDDVMHRRDRSASSVSRDGTEFAEDSPSAADSPSDVEDMWGLVNRQGSIKIMLDGDSDITPQAEPWAKHMEQELTHVHDHVAEEAARAQEYNQRAFTANGYTESPVNEHDGLADEAVQDTPRKHDARENTLKPTTYHMPSAAADATFGSQETDSEIARAIDDYQTTSSIRPEMLDYLQSHSVDLQRMSANGGSDAIMVQNLLDSLLLVQPPQEDGPGEPKQEVQTLQPTQYQIPAVTPDTPPDAAMATGTAVVYSNRVSYDATPETEHDFRVSIRQADEDWEREHQIEDAVLGADEDGRPTPPPKDIGYTPRSSTGPNSATFPPNFIEGLRISTVGDIGLSDFFADMDSTQCTPVNDRVSPPTSAPPAPNHAPPPPPPPSASKLPYGLSEVPPMPATYSERGSNEMSPRVRKNLYGPSGSSRPSMDSQLAPGPPSLPGAQSMSSFTGSTRHSSVDTSADSQTRLVKTTSPGPEQKRLMKRRHIIKELLDTENTYHQDLKIIEDIYKATVVDLVTPEDKKTLFGNCDEIERFSLFFYDEMRKAVAAVYVPPKQMRWANKRGSFSTMQSDTTGQTSVTNMDAADEEKDRGTLVGQCFLANLQQMDHVYGAYLKNHDAANQRLSALKNTPTVKCWLDECHNNASDITSAWDLDSLLVKPTQRVSKYPMLLQQLLETTPSTHPDHESLKAAAKESIGMLTRINEAKKRADIVDQIINRKGKETDMRTGIAKAFGRRTEKLKERVGIAEAFQDAEFDELSHKFGGHFIRLQICMRDVQDYLHRIDKAMDQISNCAGGLELYTDVAPSSLPEIESKWRKYGQVIRDITNVTFPEHKAAVHKRVIQPMITCIKLHEGPQNAINKRKRRIIDYAKCKSVEKKGEKPDKKTLAESEMYVALNDQLKIELPKLYGLTASLVQGCLACFLDIQLTWYNMWERKLRPILEAADIPSSIQQIEPAFRPDYELVRNKLTELAICNGAALADSANFLSPTTTLVGDPESSSSSKRPSILGSSKRTYSVGSDSSPMPGITKRYSYGYVTGIDAPPLPTDGRIRSSSSLSTRGTPALQTPASGVSANRPWASSTANTPTSSFSASRPATANAPSSQQPAYQPPRQSADNARSPRPASGQTYFTARPDPPADQRYSGIFTSAYPPDTPDSMRPISPKPANGDDMPVMFVCASLFEFSIDKTRKEGGYPYLTYVQGEVFDVIAQKGELWLAKNQDDGKNGLGWIWEQHFVILSQD
ncbi:hypothetical protein LTR36_002178 [Oleoguttula mirabilis]|uniref:DH domain-containing protein n=1 Tax=Oleoguttula mirabilis TaxID=1507867 RepID=A0AAV9JM21_9PEZI|nr:hypothetical protein LTR36_002178 [Oleoguttula mirabilis]